MDAVQVLSIDSELTPFEMGAWSSRGTHMTASAVGQASREMADRLRELARAKLGACDVALRDGRAEGPDASISLGDLVRLSPDAQDGMLSLESSYLLESTDMLNPRRETANLSPTYSFAAHGAEVEVDRRTGKVAVVDYVAAHDLGRAINPTLAESQIIGAAVMGIGAALGEELIREGGQVVNPSYLYYALPRCADLPTIRPIIINSQDPNGPYGAKNVGELPTIPPGAAIANAVYDAIGVRIRQLPITPDKILTALAAKEGRTRHHHLWRRPGRWWIALLRWAYPLGVHYVLHRWGTKRGRGVGPRPGAGPVQPELHVATSVPDACAALTKRAVPVGGSTDALTEHRLHPHPPTRLVALSEVTELRRTRHAEDGTLVIGAAVTLTELATELAETAPAVAEAIETIASAQIRNAATVGGNLVQAKRCWFFRNGFPCYKRNGVTSPCYAILGDHRFQHAVVDGDRCQAVTPSDLATVLLAYDAEVVLTTGTGIRTIALADFYTGPGETVLRAGEIVTAVSIPASALLRTAIFEKLALYTGDFAIASVAIAARIDQAARWHDVRIVLGATAPTPWRLSEVEHKLEGTAPSAARVRAYIDAELDRHAHPLSRNGWKLDALAGLSETAAERLTRDIRTLACNGLKPRDIADH